MKKSTLYALWGIFYIICAGLGFIPEPSGAVRFCLICLSVLFFVPPALLLHGTDRKTTRRIRLIAAASLILTVAVMLASITTAMRSEQLGNAMHILLGLVSAPMFCSTYWALSLFLWAALFFASLGKKRD